MKKVFSIFAVAALSLTMVSCGGAEKTEEATESTEQAPVEEAPIVEEAPVEEAPVAEEAPVEEAPATEEAPAH